MFAILAASAELERSGRKLIHMEIGDTPGFKNPRLEDCLQKEFTHPHVGYGPSLGVGDLRALIASLYSVEKQVSYKAENVVIGSANAMIGNIFTVLTDPGDAILIPDPGFATYQLAAAYNGLTTVNYSLCEAEGWNPDVEQVRKLIATTPRLRLIVINDPSNPTGAVHDPKLIEEIVEMAWAAGIHCMFDETYKNLIYGCEPRLPKLGNKVMYLYSFSKDCAAPGLRMGCVVGDAAVISKLGDFNSLSISCPPPSFQFALQDYLTNCDPQAFYNQSTSYLRSLVGEIDGIFSAMERVTYAPPKAAFYFYLKINDTGLSDSDFAMKLLAAQGVCVCPGSGFGPSGENYVRVSISGRRQDVIDGCEKIKLFVNSL